jgi:hypothetical protein
VQSIEWLKFVFCGHLFRHSIVYFDNTTYAPTSYYEFTGLQYRTWQSRHTCEWHNNLHFTKRKRTKTYAFSVKTDDWLRRREIGRRACSIITTDFNFHTRSVYIHIHVSGIVTVANSKTLCWQWAINRYYVKANSSREWHVNCCNPQQMSLNG